MKHTAKSCSCTQCKRGKSTEAGKQRMKLEERKFRRKANQQTRRGDDTVAAAPIGNYFD